MLLDFILDMSSQEPRTLQLTPCARSVVKEFCMDDVGTQTTTLKGGCYDDSHGSDEEIGCDHTDRN